MTCISTQSFLRPQRLFSLTSPEENSMLKISFSETPAEERWILHGWLTDPWVHELRTCWRKNHRTHVGRACVVDLNEVTFIDKSGEPLLCKLAKEGAQFTASGTYTKHILEHLNILRKRNSWNLLGFLMMLVFVTVLGAGCERRVASAAAPPAPAVEVTPVIQKDVPVQGEWVGTLEGYVNAQISPQVSGYLIRQDYHEGAFVKRGQVLFEIDPRPFQAVLDQAKGQLAQAEAQMANAELNLGYTRVVSLVDGIAGINTVQVGNLVGPSTVLTAVSQVSPIKVYFPISEQEYLRMADGGGPGSVDFITHASRIPLQLTLADGSTYPHPGKIIFADRQVNEQTGTIQIVGEFPNSKNLLRPGQYARVHTPTGSITGALLVPQAAVNQQQGTYQVTVVGADNRAQLRTVAVGPRVDTLWVITSGLKPGERVVAVGAEKARNGEVVNPRSYKESEER